MPILFAYNNQIWNAFTIFLQEAQEEERNIGNVHQHKPCVNIMFCICRASYESIFSSTDI